MIHIAGDKMKVPLVADSTIVRHWYEDDVIASLNESFNKLIEKGISPQESINQLIKEHSELLPDQIENLLTGKCNYLWQ